MTPFDAARKYLGVVKERPGASDHPLIQWWFELSRMGRDVHDEVPWCSAFVNGVAWELGLERSENAAARSWLQVGTNVPIEKAVAGDVVILTREGGGHVGFYAGHSASTITLLGGNQANTVSLATFDRARLLGVRRLSPR
jgi:uncharacterized protein (TIGR02594 family)